MSETPPPVETFLFSIDSWSIDKDDYIVNHFDENGDHVKVHIERCELAGFHPDLPIALALMFDAVWDKRGETLVYGNSISYTLTALKGEMFVFEDTVRQTRYMSHIETIEDHATNDYQIYIRGTDMDVRTAEVNGRDIPYVLEGQKRREMMVLRSELEAKFPGWLARWDIAKSMELDIETTTEYVFSNKPVPAINLPTITFD